MKQGAVLSTPYSVPRVGGTSADHDADCNAFMQQFPMECSLQQTPTQRNPTNPHSIALSHPRPSLLQVLHQQPFVEKDGK
jgi:hypothetical protein